MNISHYIRLQNAFRLVPPLIIILLLFVLHKLNFTGYIYPPSYSNVTDISEDTIKDCPFGTITLYNLNYTGLNIVKKGDILGGYYYFFQDDKCYLVAISDKKLPQTIDSVSITARFEYNSKLSQTLMTDMSDLLDWNVEDLSTILSPLLIDETGFSTTLTIIVGFLILVVASIAIGNILLLLLGLIIPSIALATRHQNNLFLLPRKLAQAEKEIKDNVIHSTNGMYITDNYFINLNFNQVCVVPLDQIVWAYYHSVLHGGIFFKHTITYSLRLVNDKRQIFSVSKKTKAQCSEILELISTRYPEVMIGYSDDNHVDFLYKIKSLFSTKEEDDI